MAKTLRKGLAATSRATAVMTALSVGMGQTRLSGVAVTDGPASPGAAYMGLSYRGQI